MSFRERGAEATELLLSRRDEKAGAMSDEFFDESDREAGSRPRRWKPTRVVTESRPVRVSFRERGAEATELLLSRRDEKAPSLADKLRFMKQLKIGYGVMQLFPEENCLIND